MPQIQAALQVHHIHGQWFRPSPEVWAFARGEVLPSVAEAMARGRKPGRKLDPDEVREVFRAANGTGLTYAVIGSRYGIGPLMVGRIARGESHAELIERTTPDPDGVYYVGERTPGAPRYRYELRQRGGE